MADACKNIIFLIVFKAVKPGVVTRVLDEVRPVVDGTKLIVSLAAAVTIINIQSHLLENAKVGTF